MKTVVKTFMPQFAPMVKAGTKRQTVRPRPKREKDIPRQGDRFSGREWTGKPYLSKQRILIEGLVTYVAEIRIRRGSLSFFNLSLSRRWQISSRRKMTAFAQSDGFESLSDFHAWFLPDGKTEFKGIFIAWQTDGKGESNLEVP